MATDGIVAKPAELATASGRVDARGGVARMAGATDGARHQK